MTKISGRNNLPDRHNDATMDIFEVMPEFISATCNRFKENCIDFGAQRTAIEQRQPELYAILKDVKTVLPMSKRAYRFVNFSQHCGEKISISIQINTTLFDLIQVEVVFVDNVFSLTWISYHL